MPASPEAAGSGFVAAPDVYAAVKSAMAFDTYRGLMLWDSHWDQIGGVAAAFKAQALAKPAA